jgi:hypothetical protein
MLTNIASFWKNVYLSLICIYRKNHKNQQGEQKETHTIKQWYEILALNLMKKNTLNNQEIRQIGTLGSFYPVNTCYYSTPAPPAHTHTRARTQAHTHTHTRHTQTHTPNRTCKNHTIWRCTCVCILR